MLLLYHTMLFVPELFTFFFVSHNHVTSDYDICHDFIMLYDL